MKTWPLLMSGQEKSRQGRPPCRRPGIASMNSWMTVQTKGDLTVGPIGKKLLLFAAPLLLGSLVQQLYNTVDLIFVGKYIGSSASAAIGASSLLITCLVGFFGGMSVGSGVVIAQLYGAKDKRGLSRAVHNTAALCLAGEVLMMALGYLLAPGYLRLIRTPESIRCSAVSYLRIYFFSLLSIITYNLSSGVIRALGDSKTPLYAQLAGGLVNIVMDYLFVRVFENGVTGVAWASLISQSLAALIVLRKLTRLDEAYALRPRRIAFDSAILKKVLRIGVPAGAQALVITLSNVMVQYHINSLGEDAIAAFTAYFKVELIVYLPIVALGQAMMTFAGQYYGAGQLERVRRGTLQCTLISMALAAVTSGITLVFGAALFRVFNREASVIALGLRIIGVTFPSYFIYSVLQIVGDSLRGVGRAKGPMLIILINLCLVRTALLFLIVPRVNEIRGVAVCYPITWALTAACMLIYYVKCILKERPIGSL